MKGIYIFQKTPLFFSYKQSTGLARKNACMPPKVACRTVPASASTTLSSDRLFSVSCGGQICEPKKWKFAKWRSNKYLNKYLTQRWVVSKIWLFFTTT